jgi:hypothetical protein
MNRTYLERQHLTERYQARQANTHKIFYGPYQDPDRRPEFQFLCAISDGSQFPYRLNYNPTKRELGHWRKHTPFGCSCHMCRSVRAWEKASDTNWDNPRRRKIRKEELAYQEGLEEYYSDDK